MLVPDATYPYPGSYALYEDPDRPYPQPTELVRIMWRSERLTSVSFPLRPGAGGNKAVPADQLLDATPLTREEQREFHDLDRALFGRSLRTRRQQAMKARRDALHRRTIWAPFMAGLLRTAALRRAA